MVQKMKTKNNFSTLDYEKCIKNVGSKFDLVILAAQRAREIKKHNNENNSDSKNNIVYQSLKEFENNKIPDFHFPIRRKK